MTVYLTKQERKLYDGLPAGLKKSWGGKVEEETGTVWETDEELDARARYAQKNMSARTKLAVQKMFISGEKHGFDNIADVDFPKDALPYVLMAFGAVGLTAVIDGTLRSMESAEEFESLEESTAARHRILLSNASSIPK